MTFLRIRIWQLARYSSKSIVVLYIRSRVSVEQFPHQKKNKGTIRKTLKEKAYTCLPHSTRVGIPPTTFFSCKDKFNFPSRAKGVRWKLFFFSNYNSFAPIFILPPSSPSSYCLDTNPSKIPYGVIIVHFELNQVK